MGRSAAYYWVIFAIFTCFNLPFIIADLVFATRNATCTLAQVEGLSFTLSTWFQVDGYTKLVLLILFFIVAMISCCDDKCAQGIFICILIIVVIYSIFYFIWLIIGSVLFGFLNREDICSQQITGYMYAVLIIGYLSVCCNVIASCSQKNK